MLNLNLTKAHFRLLDKGWMTSSELAAPACGSSWPNGENLNISIIGPLIEQLRSPR